MGAAGMIAVEKKFRLTKRLRDTLLRRLPEVGATFQREEFEGKAEIVIDELPFGLFMEIEGTVSGIKAVERKLGLKGLRAELATYPRLAEKHGKSVESLIGARF